MGGGGGGEDGKTGLSDDDDDEDGPPAAAASSGGGDSTKRKVVDSDSDADDDSEGGAKEGDKEGGKEGEKEGEENASSQPAAGHTGLSDSDSGDEAPRKEADGGDQGDTEMADATHKDVFGDSDSDEDEAAGRDGDGNKHKGQKVLLNKETGQLERGPVEDAPDHAINDSEVGRDRSHVPKETLKLSFPKLPRLDAGARLVYLNPPKRHIVLDPAKMGSVDEEAKRIAEERAKDRSSSQVASMVRWRYKDAAGAEDSWETRAKESNARFVQWSDGSMTLHVGSEVLEVKQETLGCNMHHLYAKHAAAEGEDESEKRPPIIEGHGVMDARLVIKPTGSSATP